MGSCEIDLGLILQVCNGFSRYAKYKSAETHGENAKSNEFVWNKVEPFAFYLAYQIFDDSDMLLIVDNESHSGASDNALCLWTRNEAIITAFTRHFDSAWRR